MKTKILNIFTLVFLVSSMFFTSCSESFLDAKDPNRITDEIHWKSAGDVESGLATSYHSLKAHMKGYFGAFTGYQNMNVRGDDMWPIPKDDGLTWDITLFVNSPNSARTADVYEYLYKSIHRANVVLFNIDRVTSLEPTKKAELIGEAKFLRGLNYFFLVTNYGSVPLRLLPATEAGEAHKERSPEATIWAQVEADFKDAKNSLPVERTTAQKGRADKGAAIAYLGKTYLYCGKFKEAKAELDLLLKSPYKYDLVSNYEDNFRPDSEFNKESIFELNYGTYGSGSWSEDGSNTTTGMVLPNFLGAPCTGGWFKLMPSAFIIKEFIKEQRLSGSDTRFDKRMYTSFYFKYSDYNDTKPDDKWYGSVDGAKDTRINMDTLWNSTIGKRTSAKEEYPQPVYPTIDGKEGRFIPKKYTDFWSNKSDGNSMYDPKPHDNNFRVMRFAEVLLMHAEAAVQTGDMTSATSDLKRIRDRAGLPNKTFSGKDQTLDEIRHQKLLELFMEGQRFYDLKRWYSTIDLKKVLEANDKVGANNFQEKHLYFPIPQTELSTNNKITQNDLWK